MRHTLIAAATIACSFATANAAGLRVIDGDTVIVSDETIRILNIDTPEIRHAQCDAERRLGLVAKKRLEELLLSGEIEITRGDGKRTTDKYGRTLAVLSVRGDDVGEALIADGLARPWAGKREPWCDKVK